MNHICSYPSIYAIGHSAISDIFSSPVAIEEKIDGSQFSFGRIDGEFVCRSKGKNIIPSNPEKMFSRAVSVAMELRLTDGWIYRAEYLQSPKHNTLKYGRVPNGNLIIFDIQTGIEKYLSWNEKNTESKAIGLECVPLLHEGRVESLEMFNAFLDRESVLGEAKIEGVVVKNYSVFTREKKISIGKYVSEAFKEVHNREWKISNPSNDDFITLLAQGFKTESRWKKAIQHLRDDGKLEWSPRDIGALMKEIPNDVEKECADEIKSKLWDHFWPKIRRQITGGFPEFYKQELAASAFSDESQGMSVK